MLVRFRTRSGVGRHFLRYEYGLLMMTKFATVLTTAFVLNAGCNQNDTVVETTTETTTLLEAGPDSDRQEMPPRKPFDITRCYPYIVTKSYPFGVSELETGLVKPFARDLFVAIVQDQNGWVQFVVPNELIEGDKTADEVREAAFSNLNKLFHSGSLEFRKSNDGGPNNEPFVLVGNHWSAAACILLPELRVAAQQWLKTVEIVAFIPNRDILILFPMPQDGDLIPHRNFIFERESNEPKQLTFEPFKLTERGPVPLPVTP